MDLNKLMQQAQAMQKNLEKIENELNETVYEGSTGGSDGVSIKMTGAHEVQEVQIAEDLMSADNREMLQDMLLIAFNDAVTKATSDRNEKIGSATKGMNIPGMR